MNPDSSMATPDLRAHFAWSALPFTREIDVHDRFLAPATEQALADLRRAVENRMSAALIAPSGSGKTLLLRALKQSLPEARYRVHDVKVTDLSKRDMCREIALACGLPPVGTYPSLLRRLQEGFATQLDDEGLRPVLLLDEAQDMRPEVLAILRILTNFDLDSRLVLSIVLAGDARLQLLLERQQLEPVRRRLAHVATLPLLARDQTWAYLQHRLRLAGAEPQVFLDEANDAVYEITRGNLRAIDHLCFKSLELAARAERREVSAALVANARRHLLL
jgi:type II secretory pathway predicted ATPase ExeA